MTHRLSGIASGVTIRFASRQGVSLVVEPPPSCESELHLCPPVFEVDRQRDEGERLLLGLPYELVYLAPVNEELPLAVRVMCSEPDGLLVGGDMHAEKPQFAPFHLCVGVGERDATVTK